VRLGMIGCGSIGSAVVKAVAEGRLPGVEIIGVAGLTPSNGHRLTLADLLKLKPDLVLEAASAEAVRSFSTAIFECGADLMIVSVGALADPDFLLGLIEQAKRNRRHIYVPSGAIGGLDIIKAAAACGGLEECKLTTTKPPSALNGAPYVIAQGIDLTTIREATVVFEGNAGEAVRAFPQNLNVAATLSLAGFGLDRTMVKIVADPAATRNVHEVFVRGTFGEATIRLVNQPNSDNPKTSYLASLSVITTLQCVSQQFQLGS
jgi:aspartate dehydrogenase